MDKLQPALCWLAGSLCALQVYAADTRTWIAPQQMVGTQELPSLDGALPVTGNYPAQGVLTLPQAVERAVAWHPSISEVIGKLYAQVEQVDVARAKYYPQINAGMNNGYTNSYADSGFSPSFVLSLSQMLYDFGKVASQVRAENAGVAQEQANVLISIDTVSHETATSMVQVQTWQQMADIAEEQLAALSAIGKLTRQRNDEGASSLSDVVQTNARIEGARSQLVQYKANLDSAQATLMTWLGWQNLNTVSNEFPQKLMQSCAQANTDDRLVPSVLATWAQANIAQANLDYANAQMTPTVSLEPEVRHYLNDNYSGHESIDRTQYSAWVKVEMPIYQGGGLTARRNAASHAVASAQSAIQRARLDVRKKLVADRSEALNLASALQIQQRQQALSERTRELYQQQYIDLGSRPLLDVLNAEQEVYQTRFAQQQTLSQIHQLQLNCLYNTGKMRQAFGLENRTIQSVEIQQ